MAITQNTYTGNGATVLFSFTFPYLETTDIKVTLDGTITTAYTLANATTIQFNTAPGSGVAIRIYRVTDDAALTAQFYPGSAIRSQDLNDNFTQNLYVTQESNREADIANTTADAATATANTALSTSNTALTTAQTAETNSNTAISTANTASSNASAAVSTANTASANATTAVNTANAASATATSAASDAATAISTANGAVTTANSAAADAATAISTANTASSNASAAVSTANTASTNATTAVSTANSAVTTANTAVTTANSAVTTANAADSKADQAISAVANALLFTIVADVASIPGSPSDGDAIEVTDSTGIESFTPLTGVPSGFVGDSGLGVRLVYNGTGSTWTWLQYFPQDPENRYVEVAGDTLTGALGVISGSAASPSVFISGDTNTGLYSPGADQVAISTNGSQRLLIEADGDINIDSGGVFYDATNNRLGIGTPSPTEKLQVSANALINSDGTGGGGVFVGTPGFAGAFTYKSSGDAELSPRSGYALTFASAPGGTERARIDSSGRLGLGTSSPQDKLHVYNGNIYVESDSASGNAWTFYKNADRTWLAGVRGANSDAFTIYDLTADTPRFTIDPSGNVGIGVTAPDGLLTLGATISNTPSLRFQNQSANADAAISTYADGNGTNILIGSNAYVNSGGGVSKFDATEESAHISLSRNGHIQFHAGDVSTESARIDTSGRLLVGTSTSVQSDALIQAYVGSGSNTVISDSNSLANNEVSRFLVRAKVGGASRFGQFAVAKHSAITNAVAYLELNSEDAAQNFIWVDNSGILRISSTFGHTGTTSGTVVGAQTSDERVKNILGPVTYGLATLKQIEPVRYSLKSQPDIEQLGFIAQQVQPLVPQAVFDTGEHIEGEPEDAPTKLGMEYVALIPVLVNAIKELSAEVDALKAQLQAS
jgi:hypothetical protein